MTTSINGQQIVQGNKPDGSVDVNIQDQITPPLDLYFTKSMGAPVTLTSVTAIDDRIVNVSSAVNIAIGNYIGIFSGVSGEQRFYFGEVLAVNTLAITLDTPLDFAFSIGDIVTSSTRELNVDGSVTPQIFGITNGGPTTETPIDINRIVLAIDCVAPQWTDFGNIENGLVNGIVLRRVDGFTQNIWNAKSNADLALICYDMDIRTGVGTDGVSARFTINGPDKHGVVIRLYGGDSLQLIVQDDLLPAEGILKFRAIGQGQITEGEEIP
jgi:hypothetical protein